MMIIMRYKLFIITFCDDNIGIKDAFGHLYDHINDNGEKKG